MMGKIFVGIVILFLFFTIGTTPIIKGVHAWRTNETTQAAVVTTTAGQTTATVILGTDIFSESTSEVESITSSLSETPVATTYVPATQTLTISALLDGQARTLTIKYNAPVSDPIMTGIGPFLVPLIFLFVVGIVIWGVFGTGKRR